MNTPLRSLLIVVMALSALTTNAQSTRKKTPPPPAPVVDTTTTAPKKKPEPAPVSEKPLRKEFNAKKSSETYYMIPTGKSGVSIFYDTHDNDKGMANWSWTLYNTEFEEVTSKTFTVDKKLDYGQYYYDEGTGHIYILFGKADNVPNVPVMDGYKGAYEIIDLDVASKSVNRFSGEFLKKMHVNVFKSINNDVYVGGSVVPTKSQVKSAVCVAMLTCFIGGKKRFDVFPYLMKINAKSGKEINLPITKQGEVLNLEYDTTTKKILVTALDAPLPTDRNVWICEMGLDGKTSKPSIVKSTGNYYLLNAQVQSVNGTDKVIIGTYAKRDAKDKLLFGIPRKEKDYMPSSTGMFMAKVSGSSQAFLQYYPFSKFSEIEQDDAPAKMSEKKKAKYEKAKEKLSYQVLPHKIVKRGEQYVMIGEVYHASYHYVTTTTYDAQGHASTTTTRVFDGWSYDYCIVAGFDKSGNMQWNSTFPLSGGLTWRLAEQVKVLRNQDEKVVMVYAYGNTIKSRVLNGETLEESGSSVKIFTGSDEDKTKSSSASVEYWYGNYFIAYGYQKVESKNDKGKKEKRAVFYLNKVSYR